MTVATTVLSVHPRVYGEYVITAQLRAEAARFTPACTGNTAWLLEPYRDVAVHPRVYGEYE